MWRRGEIMLFSCDSFQHLFMSFIAGTAIKIIFNIISECLQGKLCKKLRIMPSRSWRFLASHKRSHFHWSRELRGNRSRGQLYKPVEGQTNFFTGSAVVAKQPTVVGSAVVATSNFQQKKCHFNRFKPHQQAHLFRHVFMAHRDQREAAVSTQITYKVNPCNYATIDWKVNFQLTEIIGL